MRLSGISQMASTPIKPLFKGNEKTPDCTACPECPGCKPEPASKTPPTVDNKDLEKDTFTKASK